MTAQTNNARTELSRQRRKAAYDALKALAIDAGYMAHERDGAGFDRLMALIQNEEADLMLYSGRLTE